MFSSCISGSLYIILSWISSFSNSASAFSSPSRTWGVLYNHSLPCPSSLCSREWPLRVPEPKRPSPPPGRTPQLTSTWISWARACSHPSLACPPSTPSNKVRGIVELARAVTLQPGSPSKHPADQM